MSTIEEPTTLSQGFCCSIFQDLRGIATLRLDHPDGVICPVRFVKDNIGLVAFLQDR